MENEYCNACRNFMGTADHFEKCEKDHEGIAEAKRWIKWMEMEDRAISLYHELEDEGQILPPISEFIRSYMQGKLI